MRGMVNFIEKKRQGYISLLEITEAMNKILQSGDLDAVHEAVSNRDDIIHNIIAIDTELPSLEHTGFNREIDEVLALIERIADLNEVMINNVTKRLDNVGKELISLSRGAEVAARYARLGSM